MSSRLLIILGLLFSGNLFSQTAPASAKQTLFFEKVYLHLDRAVFYAGEDIWFKAYLLNAQGNQLISTSNNLYVELIDPNAVITERKVIRLDNGLGKGDFELGDSISPGIYKVRAYTKWMLNFGDNFIFEKKITVSGLEGLTTKSLKTSAKTETASAAIFAKETIRFFPEGGSMIEGVTGVIAFKAESASGKGIKASGSILSSKGDTISVFESGDNGFGSFMLKPEAGEKYQVKAKFENKRPFNSSIPEFLSQGFSLHLIPDSVKTTVVISTNEATLNRFKGKELEIKARHAGIPYFSKKIDLQSLITKVIIPNTNLPEGIASVTLTDDQLRPHCERLVFIKRGFANDKVELTVNKTIYRSKERVTLKIKTTNVANMPIKANLSLAVVDAGIVPETEGNIVSYINLESELRGNIENPQAYFDSKNSSRFKQLDLLLMTQGWRDFVWKRIKDTTLTVSHLNETGFTISGQVRDKSGKSPLMGSNVTLFASGVKGQKLIGTTTDKSGKYYFDNINLEGNQNIKLVSADSKARKTGMLFLDSLYSKPYPVKPFGSKSPESAQLAAFKKEMASRIDEMKKFDLSDTILLNEVAVKSKNSVDLFGQRVTSFGYPDQNFTITDKDDKDYNSLRHYLITNVNGASPDDNMDRNGVVFRANGKPHFPIFMIDRREDAFDRMDYYDLQMKDIQKVVVRHMVGMSQSQIDSTTSMSTLSGISDVFLIYLTLKPSAYSKKEPSILNTYVNGYYQARMFYEPANPQTQLSSKKDVRTTIHWQPSVITAENGEAVITYYNADPKTKVRVVVEGVNDKGIPVSGNLIYEVR
ncbi:hypothetical protein WG906_00600 [Pedobacter sp. P351]|uniref:hypothetical protein n=1 Tax=Pedobacter superstes TaxID=3133441 RepID=UPI0030A3BE12